ncbi:MAG: hypothetical protein RL722_839 [Pseudomonadota bacterium]|jgi:hypothetical protein
MTRTATTSTLATLATLRAEVALAAPATAAVRRDATTFTALRDRLSDLAFASTLATMLLVVLALPFAPTLVGLEAGTPAAELVRAEAPAAAERASASLEAAVAPAERSARAAI